MPHSYDQEKQQLQSIVVDVRRRGQEDLYQPREVDQEHLQWEQSRRTASLTVRVGDNEDFVPLLI